jgi:hypothetical protein
MKSENEKDPRQRLLRDVFAEDFEPAPEEITEVLREFRVAWWRRKTVRAMLAAAALVALAVFAPHYLREEGDREQRAQPNAHVSSAAVEMVTAKKVETISDEELLSLFPQGSCFLAELDGKQVLVFKDAKLRGEFLE